MLGHFLHDQGITDYEPHYGSWGQKGCFSVNSMREFADLLPKARQIVVASVMKAHQLLIDNLAAARGSRDDNDSLAG
jgi:hypothetical protein